VFVVVVSALSLSLSLSLCVQSTISGQVLLLTGQVDERTIAKYEKEAKEKVRGKTSFFLSGAQTMEEKNSRCDSALG
jgi:hypothetical protein